MAKLRYFVCVANCNNAASTEMGGDAITRLSATDVAQCAADSRRHLHVLLLTQRISAEEHGGVSPCKTGYSARGGVGGGGGEEVGYEFHFKP